VMSSVPGTSVWNFLNRIGDWETPVAVAFEELVRFLRSEETQALRGPDRIAVAEAVDDWLISWDTDDAVLRRQYQLYAEYLSEFPARFRIDPDDSPSGA